MGISQSAKKYEEYLSVLLIYVTKPTKIDHLSTKIADSFIFALSQFNNYLYYSNNIFITTAKFNGLSSPDYRNGILHSEWKLLAEIRITPCNLHSIGQFKQAQSQILEVNKILLNFDIVCISLGFFMNFGQ